VIVIACSAQTIRQNRIWRNGQTLWEATLSRNPACYVAAFNLGNDYKRLGDYATALYFYRRAERIRPGAWRPKNQCALCYDKLGRTDDAIRYYRKVLDVLAGDPDSLRRYRKYFARYLRAAGRTADARAEHGAVLEGKRRACNSSPSLWKRQNPYAEK